MKKIFLTLMSCVVALAAYATVTEFDIDESSFIANDNTSSLTTANVTFSNGVARIEGNTSASNKRLHTNHLTLAAGKYSLSAWVKAESAAAKARIGWTNPNPSDASKTVFNYDANPTTLSQGADYVEISMEFELSASTDVTLFVSNNGKTGNAILLNRLVLSSDGNSGTDPVTPPTGCTESGSCGDNLQWCYNSSTHTLTITGSGAMYDAPWYSFRSEITSVNLPDGLTSIGKYAFAGCSGLTSVTIPNSVTSIGDFAFDGCTSLTSINIPNSVTTIGDIAFEGCSGLTSVVLGNSVTSIGEGAFSGCSGLTSVTIPNSVTSIGGAAFSGCTSLASVTIGNSVTSIGNSTFYGCSSLTSVTIPNSVTSIGYYAFEGCSGLTSVTIGNSVTSIGDWAFYECTSLTSINIPNSVTSIGEWAFYECTGLTSITIPNSVTSIGDMAFDGCSGLTSVTIPNSVTSIGDFAFYGCTSLTSINIPNSVTSIGEAAFSGCTGLTSIVVEQGNTKYDNRDNCNAIIETETNTLIAGCQNTVIPNSVTSIGKEAFDGCSGLTSVTIPNSVTSIGDFAFYGCTSLTSINIPNSVTSIGFGAFAGCSGLTSVRVEQGNTKYDSRDNCNAIIETATNTLIAGCQNTVIPISVTSIGDIAFYECTGLTSVTIPNSVTSIGNSAFLGCTGLTSVVLGNGVKTISPSAFYGCTGLQSITCYSMLPPTVTSGSETAQFETLPYSTIVYVPADYLKTYMMHDIWGLYDVRPIGSTTVQTTDLMVTPHYTTADVVWPTVDNAATYELVITQNGTVVCTLVFNAQGQLTSIAFRAPAESARAAGQGFQFTVTGLEDGSAYSLTLNAKDAVGNVLRTFSKEFSTGYTAIEEVNADGVALKPRKVLEEGRVIILMPDGRKFDASGRQIK